MKNLFVALLYFVPLNICLAQVSYDFLKFGDTLSNNRGSACIPDENDNMYFTGTISNGLEESDDILFCKIDADGSILWQFNYGSFKNEFVNNMIRYDDEYFIICGDATDPSNGNVNGFLLKVDTSGEQQWLVEYGFTGSNEDFYGLVKMSNGEIAVTGFKTAESGTGNDVLMIRYDADGNVIQKVFFGEDINDYGMGIVEGENNSIYVSGDRISEGSNYNAFLAKIDAEGNVVWDHMNGFSFNNGCKTIMKNSGGNIMLVGESALDVSPVFNIMVSEIDTAGNFLWTKWLGESGAEAGYDISEPLPGNYFIAGFGYNYATLNNDIITMHIDGEGNEIARKYFGGTGVDYAYDIKSDETGNYYVSGFTNVDDDILFALIHDSFEPVDVDIQQEDPGNAIQIFPNPVEQKFYISSPNIILSVEIRNMQGQLLIQRNINDKLGEMTLPYNCPGGIYNAAIFTSGSVICKKIIVK